MVALYAQVRGGAGGGGESAKVGEAEVDVQQAAAAGGGSGALQLWWQGDDADGMSPQERLIATLPYSIRPATQPLVEESKQQLSYVASHGTHVSASPPAPASLHVSRRASLASAVQTPHFTLTLTVASCSVVRLSRLQLRAQCSLPDFNAPLTALTPPATAPPAATASSASFRLSVPVHSPVAECAEQLLRVHLSIDSLAAAPVGYFDLPLRPLLSDTRSAASGVLCEGVRKQQWSAVHAPSSDMHIGSIEYALQWSLVASTS